MEGIVLLEKYLMEKSVELPGAFFMIDLVWAALLSLGLRFIYVSFGNGVSNRRKFGNNFILLTLATMIVLTIVKSSPALTLGLIGALSVVRFRSAIKEPEELTFLFLSIVIGLGIGAGMRIVASLALILILLLVYIFYKIKAPAKTKHNLHVSLSTDNGDQSLEAVLSILKKKCNKVELASRGGSKGMLAASFWIDISNVADLSDLRSELEELQSDVRLSYLG